MSNQPAKVCSLRNGHICCLRMSNPPKKSAKSPRNAATVVPKKVKTDWEAVERDYRTGQYTLRELGSKHSCDNGLISRKAKKEGWTQDLSIAIKQATNAKLVDELVSNEVSKNHQKVSNTIEAAAEVNKIIILGHRIGLNRLSNLKGRLLDQIEQTVENMPDLAEVIEMVRRPDDNGVDKANDALRKVLGRSALVDDFKKLVDVDEKIRKGQREAFNIEALADTPDSAKPKRIRLEFIDVEAREI